MEYHTPFTLIIADDDQDDRELLSDLFLNNKSFELMSCLKSGIEVFDEISRKKNVPDILLIDMYMPYFTGVEVVNALETMNAAPTTIKFVISGDVNLTEKEKHYGNPYVIFIKKPVTNQEINNLPGVLLERMNQRIRQS